MKGKIFMYLFLFTALLVVFMYANEKKIYTSQQDKIAHLEQKVKVADSLNAISEDADIRSYFSLEGNEKAYTYLEKSGVNVNGLEQRIQDTIISQNTQQGNPLIPFENDNGIFRVNKVHVLNHKWVIADFTNGKRWGELLLSYTIDDKGEINLNTLQSLIYPLD